jgi:hypothetical protein
VGDCEGRCVGGDVYLVNDHWEAEIGDLAILIGELVSLVVAEVPCFAAFSWRDMELNRGNYVHGRTHLGAAARAFGTVWTQIEPPCQGMLNASSASSGQAGATTASD